MSGSVSAEKNLKDLTLVASTANLRILGFTATGSPYAVEPSAFAQAPAGSVALSSAVPVALGSVGLAGSATTASRADHVHPFPNATQVGAASAVHTHSIADISSLQAALDSKSPTNHTHNISAINGLQAALDAKAAVAHTHAISDISSLQAALDAKLGVATRGAVNGVAPLDSAGKVPLANLPATSAGVSNVNNGSIAGDVPVWNATTLKYDPAQPKLDTAKRIPTVERNGATVISFAEYNNRTIVLTGNAPLTLAASEAGPTGDQGIVFLIKNRHTAVNTITFGAGITVDPYPLGTGTAGAVKIDIRGSVAVQVYPVSGTLVAEVRGQIV